MPKKKTKTPKPYISWTQLETFHDCPKLYEAKYIKKLLPERNYPMKLGSAMHLAARAMNVQASKGQELSTEGIKTIFKAAVKTEMGVGELQPVDYQQCLDALVLYGLRLTQTIDTMHAAEYEVDIPYKDGVMLKVILDRVDYMEGDGLHIIDYKNGYKILSKEELRNDRQGNIYMYAATQILPGISRIKFSQVMFRYRAGNNLLQNSIEVDAEEVSYIKEWIDEMLEGIISKKYPARINRRCHQCQLRSKCAEYKKRFKAHAEQIDSMQAAHEELIRITASMSLLKERRDELWKAISYVAERNGVVPVEDGKRAYVFKEQEKREIPAKPMAELFSKNDMNILSYLVFSASSFEAAKAQLFQGLTEEKIQAFKEEAVKIIKTSKQTRLTLTRAAEE